MSTAELKTAERGQYLISVDARRAKGSFTLELDDCYSRKPGLKPSGKEPPAGSNPKPPFIPPRHKQTAGAVEKDPALG